MNPKHRSKMYDRIHFAVMAIEGGARRLHISGQKMHDRLKAQNLIHERLLGRYDDLHTQSFEWVVDDTVTALKNWETGDEAVSWFGHGCARPVGKSRLG